MAAFYGIDGCPSGWIAIGIGGDDAPDILLAGDFEQLVSRINSATLALVDMPIGLPSLDVPDRVCDRAARQLIGKRCSSVFPVPARAALTATGYTAACEINSRELGRRLSRQSWNILPRIAEIDALMISGRLPPSRLREMHPEVAFTALNNGHAMSASKKTADGHRERLATLTRWLPQAPALAEAVRANYPLKRQLSDDDILDALAGAVTASHHPHLATLPSRPLQDARGLAMEIVYSQMAYDA